MFALQRHVYMAFLGAGPGAGLAADAVIGMNDGHDLVAHVVTVFVIALEGFLDELKHIEPAHFVTAAAADAFFYFYGIDELRGPGLSPPRLSDDW
jgi:hypothetical protein